MKAEIISIGTELLLGKLTDTNAPYLAGQLALLGIDIYWISQVGDNQARLVEVLKRAWQRSELILTSGGLGPTEDDLTREAIAELLGEKLEIKPALENTLRERFARWNLEMPLSNLKQATIIPSARAIPNTQGTAPGWWVERDGRTLVAMPGPPQEIVEMWQKEILSKLRQRFAQAIIISRTFKTSGLSEAGAGEMVSPLLSSANPTLGIYAKVDGIQLRLTAKAESQEQAEKMLAKGEARVRAIIGEHIWGTDNDTLETAVGRLLIEKGLSLALMEDYSGGWLTASLTDIPDSSTFLKGGLVACSNEAKITCGVSADTLAQYGASSPELAQAMAEAARLHLGADVGVGITGIEQTKTKLEGIVYIGIDNGKNKTVVSRPRGKRRVTSTALFELRRVLMTTD
jgi:nicotinamide-nucleotide amidase